MQTKSIDELIRNKQDWQTTKDVVVSYIFESGYLNPDAVAELFAEILDRLEQPRKDTK